MKTVKVRDLLIGEGLPKIAVSIIGKTKKEIIFEAKKIDFEKVDLVEWRGDYFKGILNIKKVLKVLESLRKVIKNIPLIFTFRSKEEGGEKEISEKNYYYLNKKVSKSKFVDLIDIEINSSKDRLKKLIKFIQKQKVYVIASSHNFSKTPSNDKLKEKLKELENLEADILKLVVMPKSRKDVLRFLKIVNEMKNSIKKPIIAISMGSLGRNTRLGGPLTFGAQKEKSAPGQIPVNELFKILSLKNGEEIL